MKLPVVAVVCWFAESVSAPFTVVTLAPLASEMLRTVVREIAPVPVAARSELVVARLIVPVVVPSALTVRFLFAAIVIGKLNVTPAPVVRERLLVVVSAALTVIAPLLLSPICTVPAVIVSSSVSERPRGPPSVSVAVPKLIATPLVKGRSVTVLEACALTVTPVPSKRLLLMRVMFPVPVDVLMVVEFFTSMPVLNVPAPSMPVTCMAPPPVVSEPVLSKYTPWLLPPVPTPPVPWIVSVPLPVEETAAPLMITPADWFDAPLPPPWPVILTLPPFEVIPKPEMT